VGHVVKASVPRRGFLVEELGRKHARAGMNPMHEGRFYMAGYIKGLTERARPIKM